MIVEAFKQALAEKFGFGGHKQHWEPDNRATRRRKERLERKFEANPKIYYEDAKYPLAGYKSPHKPREIASRKPVRR